MTENNPPSLTLPELRALKARAHNLAPVVLIGDKGLSGAVLAEIELALAAHELIKVRVEAERDERSRLLGVICGKTHASAVQHIGKVLVLYREKPPAPPAAPKVRKPPLRKPATPGSSKSASRFAPQSAGRPKAVGGPGRPGRITSRPARPGAARPTSTGRPESRSASPRRAPARPPGRRRTSR